MISGDLFLKALAARQLNVISGVPCSYLTPLINGAIDSGEIDYVDAANEGEAVAIATGASLGGSGGVAMFQNSGLGNAVSPLTSLNWVFRIPILLITTWRGQPGGPQDEPQHELMGRIMMRQLELMEIPSRPFPTSENEIDDALDQACQWMSSQGRPFALVMTKGAVETYELKTDPETQTKHQHARDAETTQRSVEPETRLDVDAVLRTIQQAVDDRDVLLATTGFTGRALYACQDRDNQLYMVGSMGCVSTLGLGLAVTQPHRRIVVLDGDGALLMRLSGLAAVGHRQPENLLHIVLDNGVHDSTGGQATLASTVDIPAVARACGYPAAQTVTSLDAITECISRGTPGLKMMHIRTSPRASRKLPRPHVAPESVAMRLRNFMERTP